MRNRQLSLALQILVVLLASLLGIVTNYATNAEDVPFALQVLQRVAVPAIGLLILAMILAQAAVLRLERPAPPPRVWDRRQAPYPGLDAFTETEAAVFFGRETQIAEVTRRLHASPPRDAERFVPLVGASGSGKSSLAQAGVTPRLRERRWTVLPVLSPGANPLGALADMLAEAAGGAESGAVVARRLRQSPGMLSEELGRLRRNGRFRSMLLVIDQFEELITLAGERERTAFLQAVAHALAQDSRLHVLATVRIEFLHDFLDTPHAELFQKPVAIGTIGRPQLAEAVERPGALVGMTFAPRLVETILDDTGTSDALPLLAYLLQELYFASGPGTTVTEDLYRRLGGVAGALARQADHVVSGLRETENAASIPRTLLKFVTVEGGQATRRRVALAELTSGERRIVDAFVDARLLVTDAGDGERATPEAFARVAHEALFRQWPPLRQEVEARAEQLRQRAELERWAADWQRADRSADYLLTGDRLVLAQRWLTALEESGQASDAVRALVVTSRDRDLAHLRRVSESVGEYVLANAERDPELSLLLSLAALDECGRTPTAGRGLMAALASSHLRAQLVGHTDTVRGVAWSPDGGRIAAASRDGTARIFDAVSGRARAVLSGGGSMVEAVAWSPDSSKVATAGRDRVVRVWDAGSGAHLLSLTGATDIGRSVAWSPDGSRIAGTSRDRLVRVWDADTGHLVREFHGHTDDVWGVAWSPDGTRLASASHDRTALVWDIASGRSVATVAGHTDFVEGVAWSPDGRSVATASGDHTVRVSDPATGDLRLLVRGHGDYVWGVAWSPDGRSLASVSSDRTVRVFDARDAKPLAVFRGHGDTVWAVAWSPDGTRLASGSSDTTARVWDVRPRGAERVLVAGHRQPVNEGVWSPDGGRIATASDDGTARRWDAATGAETDLPVRHLDRVWGVAWSEGRLVTGSGDRTARITDGEHTRDLAHGDAAVEAVAFSPDGGRLATGGHDAVVRVWDVASGDELMAFEGHQDWVGAVAWSPGGQFLATGSDDRTCRIWDVAGGQQVTVLRGHEGYVDGVAWSPDERHVVTASGDWTAGLWLVASGRRVGSLRGHDGRVRGAAWSPDGSRVATVSDDRTVRVWAAGTTEEIGVAGVHQDKVTSVAWSPDGSALLTASFDGTARVWAADPDLDRLTTTARNRVFRSLTREERLRHMLPLTP
ncbi:WD40 repeat domain-containing protein [Streptomyces avicenniae]|uniref:WD40 repeat domain-containing protein n=1 Tax=Streptomyces avicenniae TaxID=500153 RepID=UPI00069AD2B1|nr:WD40 repeat domain-containing protein [Streptomyces avicenniae]